MTAATLTLTDFLLDRLADLELAAQIALATAPADPVEGITPAGAVWFTPEQVLADVAAKRRIVEAHVNIPTEHEGVYLNGEPGPHGVEPECDTCGDRGKFTTAPDAGCVTVALLALPYGDHPDYREEWKP